MGHPLPRGVPGTPLRLHRRGAPAASRPAAVGSESVNFRYVTKNFVTQCSYIKYFFLSLQVERKLAEFSSVLKTNLIIDYGTL